MRIIKDITNFIFIEDIPRKADIIFIPGGSYPEPSEKAASLWVQGFAPYIIPSGLYNMRIGHFPGTKSKADIYNGDYESEADFMKDVLVKSGVQESAIFLEKQAGDRGTVDNAFFSKDMTDSMGLVINKAIICCKSFHARRCLLSYTWVYPQTEFFICPSDVINRGRKDWF